MVLRETNTGVEGLAAACRFLAVENSLSPVFVAV